MGRNLKYGIAALIGVGDISSAMIADGAITDTKVNATAAIAKTKLAPLAFGGNGSDGALAITSGATNIDLAGAAIVIKNYTSVSITGTASLTFTNPHTNGTIIILKSQGNVTLTSSATPMIVASGLGAAGGTYPTPDQNPGVTATGIIDGAVHGGGGGANNHGIGAGGGAYTDVAFYSSSAQMIARKAINLVCGSGGGKGGVDGNVGGAAPAGGRGGGALYIECNGAWNFTTANGISVAGATGVAGNTRGGGFGGGGGGAAGMVIVLYNTLTANTGTITVSGGAGGAAGTGTSTAAGGGGGGAGGFSGAGTSGTAGAGNSPGAGGAGANGFSYVGANTELA